MLDYIDEETIFLNDFNSFLVELNELFNDVYIEDTDGTLLKLIEIGYYDSKTGFRLANLFFYVQGKYIKGIDTDTFQAYLKMGMENNWTDLDSFSNKVSWYINSIQQLLKIV